MKKTLIALAALAVVSAASAQSSVTIYGRAHLAVDNWSATGAAAGAAADLRARTRVVDSGSRIGFRGTEDLGGGLRAGFVIEGGINIDSPNEQLATGGAGQSGLANTGTGGFGTREAHLSLGNDTLEVRLGRQNVYWGNGGVEDVGANHMIFGGVGVFTAASSGYVTAPVARKDNTVQLFGNKSLGSFAGSSIWYSTPNAAERAAANTSAVAKAYGLTMKYAMGPIQAQIDWAKDENTANNAADVGNRNNTGLKVGASYAYASGSKASLHWYKMERGYTLAASNIAALGAALGGGNQSGLGVSVMHALGGNWVGYGQWAKLGDFKHVSLGSQADTSATAVSLGLRNNLSKRTHAYASYNVVANDSRNNVQMSGGGYSSAAIGNGADQKSIAIGILHNF